jgi:hypothetical protein
MKGRFLLGAVCAAFVAAAQAETVAVVGGTLVDVGDFGHSMHDTPDAVVVIDNGRFVAVGPASTPVPPGARIIDARGKFLVPGLIDGFGALRTQGYAKAYLYAGVTTVYVPTFVAGGGGDGELKIFRNALPGPRLFLGAPMTGYSMDGADPSDKPMREHRLHDRRLSNEELVTRIDRLADQGFRGLTISYDVWPDQTDVIVAEARRRGLAVLGEPAFTGYPYAVRAGVEALVHDDHYQTELAPAAAKLARADELSGASEAYKAVCATDPASATVSAYGKQLAQSRTALMPTLSIEATADQLDVPNPWSAAVSALVRPEDLDVPVDPVTGASGWLKSLPEARRDAVRQCGWHKEQIDARLYQLGARFLAASAAATYGVMPGSGMQLELALLHRIGLTPREALAAATGNYAELYGWPDVGRVEPGRGADLLVLRDDPRQDVAALASIDVLILRGEVMDRDELLPSAHYALRAPWPRP